MATPRFDMPMRPIPMTATEMRSFAPFTAPVKIWVVRAAPALLMKSLRSVILLSFWPTTRKKQIISQRRKDAKNPGLLFFAPLHLCETCFFHRFSLSRLGNYDVHQPVGNDYNFYNLLVLQELLNFIIRQRPLLDQLAGGSERNADAATQLAVDLHRDLGLFFLRQLGIEPGPWLPEYRAGPPLLIPHLLREVGRERGEQESQLFQDLAHGGAGELGFERIQLVHQLHDRSDRGVEMPARLEIRGDFAARLMPLSQGVPVGAGLRAVGAVRVARGEPVDAAEEAVLPFDARVQPVHIFFRRRGEQR